MKKEITLHNYQVSYEQCDNAELRIDPLSKYKLSGGQREFSDILPAFSLSVYSTYNLAHSDSGILAE